MEALLRRVRRCCQRRRSSDKNDDNTMLSHELFRLLTKLGEKLSKEEAKSLMKELCDPADEEGFMPFIPFLERMCAGL